MQGWVSIHRKIMNNPVWQDPKLLKLWMLCLLEASHKDHEQLVGKQIVTLHPGQFVTGRFALAKTYNEGAKKEDIVPERTLWRWIKMLEAYDFLSINSNTKYSVISIKNWNQYQQSDQQMSNKKQGFTEKDEFSLSKSDQQNHLKNPYIPTDSSFDDTYRDQPMSNQCPANVQQVSTNNNGNKGNNEKNNNTTTTEGKKIMEFWDANGFGFTNIHAKNKLLMFLDEGLDEDVILRALEIASNNNKVSYSYVEKVLIDWSKRGLKTIKLVQAAEAEREKQKQKRVGHYKKPIRQEQTPEWFEENPYQAPVVGNQVKESSKQAIMDKLNQFRK